jgi:hypothetical protein
MRRSRNLVERGTRIGCLGNAIARILKSEPKNASQALFVFY